MTWDLKPLTPVHTQICPEEFYRELDTGIRFPVRILHFAGYSTCQSCQGGSDHAYEYPSIDMIENRAFGAAEVLSEYGIGVRQISSVWRMDDGVPVERIWRIELKNAVFNRANDWPMFITGHLHKDCWEIVQQTKE